MTRTLPGLLLPIVCVLSTLCVASATRADDESGAFVPVSYDRTRTVELNWMPEQVCPLFEPDQDSLWIDWWKPEVLFHPGGVTKSGKVLRIESPHGEGHAILVYIHRHDPEAMEIVYSILYREVELEKRMVHCRAREGGGTVVEVRTVIIGLNDYGNRAVRQHVEAGNVEKGIDLHRDAVDEYLRSLSG